MSEKELEIINLIPELREWFNQYVLNSERTQITYLNDIKFFLQATGIKTLQELKDLKSGDVTKFLSFAKQSGWKNSVINARMRTVKSLYKWLNLHSYTDNQVVFEYKALRSDVEHTYLPSMEDMDKIFEAIKKHTKKKRLYCMFALDVATGLRRSALCNIKLNDIYNGNQIKTFNKGNKISVKTVPEDVMKIVNDYINTDRKIAMEKYISFGGKDLGYLFVSDIGDSPRKDRDFTNGNKVNAKSFYNQVKNIVRKAGVENFEKIKIHSLRKFMLTDLWRTTRDPKLVQMQADHSSSKTTMDLYIVGDEDKLKQAVENENPMSKLINKSTKENNEYEQYLKLKEKFETIRE